MLDVAREAPRIEGMNWNPAWLPDDSMTVDDHHLVLKPIVGKERLILIDRRKADFGLNDGRAGEFGLAILEHGQLRALHVDFEKIDAPNFIDVI